MEKIPVHPQCTIKMSKYQPVHQMSWDWEIESPLTAHRPTERVTRPRSTTTETCSWVKCGRWTDLVNDKSYEFLKAKPQMVCLEVCPYRFKHGEILLGHSIMPIVTRTIFLKWVQCELLWLKGHPTLDWKGSPIYTVGQSNHNLKCNFANYDQCLTFKQNFHS